MPEKSYVPFFLCGEELPDTIRREVIGRHCTMAIICDNRGNSERPAVWQQIIWNDEPGGNIEHIEEHGLTLDDVEYVLASPGSEGISRSSGQPCVFGYTPEGTFIIVVYELIDPDTIYPVTAYEVPEP